MGLATIRAHRAHTAEVRRIEAAKDPLEIARTENVTLRAENAMLKTRVSELEGLIATATEPQPANQQERRPRR